MQKNTMRLELPALSENEGFARVTVGAFMARLNPTLEEVSDVKTAVSEAVTNAIVHGYNGREGMVRIWAQVQGDTLSVIIEDDGCGIPDVDQALQPFYTTKPDMERSGMGFTVMQSFMDSLEVRSKEGRGTSIMMTKTVRSGGR